VGCTSLTSITIPSSVTSIGSDAFEGCTGLTSITIPSSVTSIGYSAFEGCTGLTSVTIPSSVTGIGDKAFYGCTNLTSITIPSVIIIGDEAFKGSSLTSVTIPGSVTSIGNDAFGCCSKLSSIDVDASNKCYSSIDGVLFNKNKTTLIQYPEAKSGANYIIPSSVTSIGDSAFYSCTGLTCITIPSSVTSIGGEAFNGCSNLQEIHAQSVTPIDLSAVYSDEFNNIDKISSGSLIKTCILYVPNETAVSLYKAAKGWNEFTNILWIRQQLDLQISEPITLRLK